MRTEKSSGPTRNDILMAMQVGELNPLQFVDWLENLKREPFWYFSDGRCVVPQYNAMQRLYIGSAWRDHYRGPLSEADQSLFDHLYSSLIPAFFLHRNVEEATGQESGWGKNGEGSTVKFRPVMDLVLNWTALHLDQLFVLHELADPAYRSSRADAVRLEKIVSAVDSGSGIAKMPFYDWVCQWLEQHIRYYTFQFCETEGLSTQSGGKSGGSSKQAPGIADDSRPGLSM
jgi:hypothetical protein